MGRAVDQTLFGRNPVIGKLRVLSPSGWQVTLPADLEIAPGDRKELALTIQGGDRRGLSILRVQGDFGKEGEAALSARLVSDPSP